ncbi:MAG: peptidoglycan-binding protein [Ferrovibrio sp.]|uniref:peptidoglycan-binding domain-containing protein n=1 Tax=Ferrovibrio sp. TaxID=1917215 RepID=UPI002613A215|nr:peptidoglycan-binding domain-containing protein [Ferrovibrio sp.]MCW0236141.1 peptidoglycan-binding protein [Ferrovibrio sp.]
MSLQSNQNNPEDLFSFAGSVGRFSDNDRADVIKAQALLANAGYYELPDPGMPTGWPGGELNRALTRFQKDHGLAPDGILLPLGFGGVTQNGMGETLQTLRDQLAGPLEGFAPPSVQEVDDFYRLRPMLGGDDEPQTNVVLRSADGDGGEPIGLKPVMSDEPPPARRELQSGQQEAFYQRPIIEGVKQIPNLLRGLGLAAPAITLPLSGDTPDTDRDALRKPEPAQPEEDRQQQDFAKPQRGRIIIAEDGKELHVPPLGTWADKLSPDDRQIADTLNDAFATEMALHTGGSRGNAMTQEGVNMAIEECMKVAREIFPDASVEHLFGGNPGGNIDKTALKEEHLWNYDENGNIVRQGSNRPDFGIAVARNVVEMVRGNTYDSDGAGNPTDREQAARDGMQAKTPGEKMVMLEKQSPEMTEQEFRKNARDACRAAFTELREDWERRGEFAKSAPKDSVKYDGPDNARRARDLRKARGKQ